MDITTFPPFTVATAPCTLAATSTAGGVLGSSLSGSSSDSTLSLNPSTLSGVSGERESLVHQRLPDLPDLLLQL